MKPEISCLVSASSAEAETRPGQNVSVESREGTFVFIQKQNDNRTRRAVTIDTILASGRQEE